MKEKLLYYDAPEIKVAHLNEEDVITASYGGLTDENDDKALFSDGWL